MAGTTARRPCYAAAAPAPTSTPAPSPASTHVATSVRQKWRQASAWLTVRMSSYATRPHQAAASPSGAAARMPRHAAMAEQTDMPAAGGAAAGFQRRRVPVSGGCGFGFLAGGFWFPAAGSGRYLLNLSRDNLFCRSVSGWGIHWGSVEGPGRVRGGSLGPPPAGNKTAARR